MRWRPTSIADWPGALRWLAEVAPDRSVGEIQFWGHGKWGCALIDRVSLDPTALQSGHPWYALLRAIRARLAPDALWWFRTCETFGGDRGHAFARAWTEFHGCRAAGHTFVIGAWQSGLHSLAPGALPQWSASEGLVRGTADNPQKAAHSRPGAANTITCFHGRIPDGF